MDSQESQPNQSASRGPLDLKLRHGQEPASFLTMLDHEELTFLVPRAGSYTKKELVGKFPVRSNEKSKVPGSSWQATRSTASPVLRSH